MDKRRRRYVMHDVYFLDDPLGVAIFDRFGAAGIALWMGFIAACKKNHIEGEMSYTSEAEALAVMGLPGLPMVCSDGTTFSLEEFWTLLGDHKVTRRRRSARRLHVTSTRWTEWQVNPRKPKTDTGNSRSEDLNTDTLSADYEHETALETERETETDISLSSGVETGDEREFFRKVWEAFAAHDAEVYTNGGGVIRTRGFFQTAAENRKGAHEAEAASIHVEHPDWTPAQVVEAIIASEEPLTPRKLTVARPPCEVCEGRGVVWPEGSDEAQECGCKQRMAS